MKDKLKNKAKKFWETNGDTVLYYLTGVAVGGACVYILMEDGTKVDHASYPKDWEGELPELMRVTQKNGKHTILKLNKKETNS